MKKTTDSSGKSRPGRPRKFDRTRALEAALKLFWEQGYVLTTTAQLCKAMGINSPSLYCAFTSKAALFQEAIAYYRRSYWQPEFDKFMQEPDLRLAISNLFLHAVTILLSPRAPCGCLTLQSALTLPASEKELRATVAEMRLATRKMFLDKLQQAYAAGQLPVDSDIAAYAGALTNFFEGLSIQASGDISAHDLREIALTALKLLPCSS